MINMYMHSLPVRKKITLSWACLKHVFLIERKVKKTGRPCILLTKKKPACVLNYLLLFLKLCLCVGHVKKINNRYLKLTI